ncbi:glucose-6-phosphate dehydrogenase [[Mycobacterium] crassicus]|uniref:Glucose-6-phosphate 1-dehydrogenase n=1 Tax=[Mycobacterium] crassicus TaxID=2872309 RepID=A0ABU5XIC3_9MYCO|nr:glucose-6-phosphate dehydrogenase [Mycolicibacter sp. MYC098]MEB3022042.1 glucose-6-phosphate dehydrogenase [Mycolicibacter sp. MYC098]
MAERGAATSELLVIFGITGDLARKMTFRALYRLERRNLLDCPILGVASDDISVEDLVDRAGEAIRKTGEPFDDAVFDRLAKRLSYLHGDVNDAALYDQIAQRTGTDRQCLYYLEMPPSLFAPIVENLGRAGLLTRARVAVEKPFGHDLTSARELNARLRAVLREEQILRVDHFLGKEPVADVEGLRFANTTLAELWDRRSIAEIHITMAENFGVEDRGSFYDSVGALRDVVQNHLLQVLALIAMEPPVGPGDDDLNDKKAEVFRAMPPADPAHCVRGRYRGYADVPGVADGSQTETFVALRLQIENWRWSGVPIFLRAGKALPQRVTEVRLFTHRVPALAFMPQRERAPRNQIVLRIDPDPGMRLQLVAQDDGVWRDVHLDSSFTHDLGEPIQPYERLLHAAMVGDRRLFAREDSIEETWRIVAPLLEHPGVVHTYEPGSWGPDAAQALVRGHRSWQDPWLPEGGPTQ